MQSEAIVPKLLFASALVALATSCHADPAQGGAAVAQQEARQLRPVPGCEGCEAAWERNPAGLGPRITLAGEDEPGEPLLLTGTV